MEEPRTEIPKPYDNERSYEYVDIELMNIADILKIDEHYKYT